MVLTTEEFRHVLSALGGPATRTAGEKRRAPRVPHWARTTIDLCAGSETRRQVTVTVRNLSSRGLAITYAAPLLAGEQFVMRLSQAGGQPVTMLCTVVHCRPLSNGSYNIGAEFTCMLDRETPGAQPASADIDRIRASMLG
jgi:hypothetical protein